MTDIVEKLRTFDAWEKLIQRHKLVHDAADEIERLRRGGCARDQTTTQFCAVAHGLAIENERLRAALRRIAVIDDSYSETYVDLRKVGSIAREALGDDD